jgi:D-tyrosyl-tRNA(Tyr) deacylase
MRALIQRVTKAAVTINNEEKRSIGPGLVVFLGITHTDIPADADYLANKIIDLRIFRDDSDKMNLSVLESKGDCLVVSQFTLYGDARKGRRPSFIAAAPPAIAIPLYERFIENLRKSGQITIHTGEFGADMLVEISNDGPVTLMIESERQIQHGN